MRWWTLVGAQWAARREERYEPGRPIASMGANQARGRDAQAHPDVDLAAQHAEVAVSSARPRSRLRNSGAAQHVQWICWRYKIPYPATMTRDGELTVRRVAERLGVSAWTVYDWISTDKLAARHGPADRLYIPFPPEVEQQCRQRIQNSFRLRAKTQIRSAGGAV